MASSLEFVVITIRTFSSEGNFKELAEFLSEFTGLMTKHYDILDDVLETLDPQQHSLGVLYILLAKFSAYSNSTLDAESLLSRVKDFLVVCNGEQLRFATQGYFELCHSYTSLLVQQQTYTQGIDVLAHAIDRITLFFTQLTPIHADLCQLCLCSKIFNPAFRFLDTDMSAIATTDDVNQDSKYFLLYYYYGGMIYAAVKNYDRALYFFEVAVSIPAMAMSHIMLEAYKKYLLISLILNGKISTIPKYSSQVISRFMKPLSQPYHELATAYASSSSEEMRSVIMKFRDIYVRDTNFGLVKQVASSLNKKNIQRLTKTFLTLSLADVASRVQLSGPMEAEKYILNMIKSGEIYASINQKDGMVIFNDNPEKYDSPEMLIKIQNYMANVMDLNNKITKMEEEIMLNPMFVKKSIGNQEDEISSGQQSKTFSG